MTRPARNARTTRRRRDDDGRTLAQSARARMGESPPPRSPIPETPLSPELSADPVPTRKSGQQAGKSPITPRRVSPPHLPDGDDRDIVESPIRKRFVSSHQDVSGRKLQRRRVNASPDPSPHHDCSPVPPQRQGRRRTTPTNPGADRGHTGTPVPGNRRSGTSPQLPAPPAARRSPRQAARPSPPNVVRRLSPQLPNAAPTHHQSLADSMNTLRGMRGDGETRGRESVRRNASGFTDAGAPEGAPIPPPSRSSSQETNRELQRLVNSLKRKVQNCEGALQMAEVNAKAMAVAFEKLKDEVRVLKMENESLKVSNGQDRAAGSSAAASGAARRDAPVTPFTG